MEGRSVPVRKRVGHAGFKVSLTSDPGGTAPGAFDPKRTVAIVQDVLIG